MRKQPFLSAIQYVSKHFFPAGNFDKNKAPAERILELFFFLPANIIFL